MPETRDGEDEPLEEDELEPFRDIPVGTNDPNIVGAIGPFDKPPGADEDNSLPSVDVDDDEDEED